MKEMSLPEEVIRLNREFDEARTADESRWHGVWDEVYRYMAPLRQRPEHIPSPESIFAHIYDSTGMDAMQSLAGNIISAAMPQWATWAMLAPSEAIQPQSPEDSTRDNLMRLLQPVNAVIGDMLSNSNFYAALPPFVSDFIVGTGAIGLFADTEGNLRARYYTPFDYSFNTDTSGRPLHVYIEHKIEAETLVKLAAERGMPFPDEIVQEKLGPSKRNLDLKLRQIVMPEKGTFREIMYIKRSGLEHVVSDRTLDYHPIIIARWAVDADNRHGSGPGMMAYPEARYLNVLRQHAMSNAMMQTTGAFTAVDDGVINTKNVVIRPGSVIPVMSNDNQNPSLRPLPITSNLELSQFEINTLRGDIRKQLFADRFSEYGDSKLSPTEIVMRAQTLARELGPAYSQLQHEFMRPVIKAAVKIAQKHDRIPKEIDLDSGVFDITYISQLEQAQRMGKIQNVVQMMQTGASYMQIDQTAAQVVDYAEGMRQLADAMQVPLPMIRTREQITEMKKQSVAMAQEIAAQNAQLGGAVGGNTGAGQ